MNYPKKGEVAPKLEGKVIGGEFGDAGEGQDFDISKWDDKPILVYFYPKDDTPGCTTQACSLRDNWDELQAKMYVLGVSPDNISSHIKFLKKYSLTFPLLSDEEHKIAESFGVWKEKSMFGNKYFGIERTSFLINKNGTIEAVFPRVKPKEHVDKILKHL